jgi:5-methylcytosine-specific restriction endonuclease McrA
MPERRTYADRREELKIAVAKKRKKVKLISIQQKGGKCVICRYNRFSGAMDFHHVVGPKEFSVGNIGYSRSWKNLKKELNKCVLLCANCHREVEGGFAAVPEDTIKKRNFYKNAIK